MAHQLLNHLLPDDAILLACQFCDCLGDRINDVICFSVPAPANSSPSKSETYICHVLPRIQTFRSNNYVRTGWDRSTAEKQHGNELANRDRSTAEKQHGNELANGRAHITLHGYRATPAQWPRPSDRLIQFSSRGRVAVSPFRGRRAAISGHDELG